MAQWTFLEIPSNRINGSTRIKDTDEKIMDIFDDFQKWANNTGNYAPNLGLQAVQIADLTTVVEW